MAHRQTIDRACGRFGVGYLVQGKTDREIWELWLLLVGDAHESLPALKTHLATLMPLNSLSDEEQRALWAAVTAFKKRFA